MNATQIALVSLVFSGLSLLVAFLAFRRTSGSRVHVKFSAAWGVPITFVNEPIYGDELRVTAQNHGTAAVEVTDVICEVKGRDEVLRLGSSYRLEGYDQNIWTESLNALLPIIRDGDADADITARRVRARVKLASGKERTSRWTRLPARP